MLELLRLPQPLEPPQRQAPLAVVLPPLRTRILDRCVPRPLEQLLQDEQSWALDMCGQLKAQMFSTALGSFAGRSCR